MKKAILVITVCLLLLAGIVLGLVWMMIASYETTPVQGTGETLAVLIPKGAGPLKVAGLLEQHEIVSSATWFYRYVRYYRRAAGKLKAGELAFRDNMAPKEVLRVLTEGIAFSRRITIAEGLRIDEVARLFADAGLADARTFEAKARDAAFTRSLGLPGDSLEGFLFPETYHFGSQTPVEKILKALVANYQRAFSPDWKTRAKEIGLTELQVVTLASIVEKETGAAQERAQIAGVFHSRLKKNWRMDTDPTVIYAVLLSRGSFNGNLTREDLRLDHPYNTYRVKGLPPGPICSPGADAIKAALWPDVTPHMFFVSRNDGTHHFCPTLSCHNHAVKRYQGGG